MVGCCYCDYFSNINCYNYLNSIVAYGKDSIVFTTHSNNLQRNSRKGIITSLIEVPDRHVTVVEDIIINALNGIASRLDIIKYTGIYPK